ncbi:MAG TPA: LPXTG cell wall anchor domain-containing protein [Microbacteriaceae bacterium]|nr:LPXTG cell wall anchor domain-containing protein [Microbacteriaceae bacterium]
MNRSIRSAIVAATTLALALAGTTSVGAANASGSAPTLPSGSTMFTVGCDALNNLSLWDYDPTNGDATLVGEPSVLPGPNPGTNFYCGRQGGYNPVNGKAYLPVYGGENQLAEVDLETGEFTLLGRIPSNDCVVTVDNEGVLYQNSQSGDLEIIDPVTLATTVVGALPSVRNCALAINPVDDQLYGFRYDSGIRNYVIVKIDKSTVAELSTVPVDMTNLTGATTFRPDSMAIDSNGIAWIQDDNYGPGCGMVAVNLATGEAWPMATGAYDRAGSLYPTASQISGNQNAEGYFYQMSVWIVPGEEPTVEPTPEPTDSTPTTVSLASTGANVAPLGTAAGVLLAAAVGVAFALRRRQRA